MSTQSEAGHGSDRWFGMFRNVVLAANIAGVIQLAYIQHAWPEAPSPYSAGLVGSTWVSVQFFLLAALGLANWISCRGQGGRTGLFWLIAGGGALCLGTNEWYQSFRIWPNWAHGSFANVDPLQAARIANLITFGTGLCAVLFGQAFRDEFQGKGRLAYYWNWGVGLTLGCGILGFIGGGHGIAEIFRLASSATILPQAFFFLAFFSEWYGRTAEATSRESARGGRRGELAASASA